MPGQIQRTRGRAAYRRAAHAAAVLVNTVAPAITGTAQVGATLTVSNGTWKGYSPTFTYQWKKDGVNIAGATNNTYVPVAGDVGGVLTAVVTATNNTGSVSATSNATAAVIA